MLIICIHYYNIDLYVIIILIVNNLIVVDQQSVDNDAGSSGFPFHKFGLGIISQYIVRWIGGAYRASRTRIALGSARDRLTFHGLSSGQLVSSTSSARARDWNVWLELGL